MGRQKFKALLISDFNTDVFGSYLNNDEDIPLVKAVGAPFGQVISVLLEENREDWKKCDFAVIWTQPESVIESFQYVLNYQPVSINKILAEVDEYSRAIMKLQPRVRFIFVPTWVLPPEHMGYGMLEMKNGIGIENILMRMNLRLSENLDSATNIYLLKAQKWMAGSGKNAFNPKLWYMAKIPFGNEVFKEAVRDIKSALRGLGGNSKKIIILDLDDTLWGGIAGEVGWQNIKLGGHDYLGEAYLDFQKALKALSHRGVLLGLVSKNEESVALEVINNHPEMILKMKDFAGWRINWGDKAKNIIDLVSDLNLGLQSVVFIDDNPLERARVREALPEVLVPEWPEDKMLYKKTLLSLRCFDTPSITQEDRERTNRYITERQRQSLKSKAGSLAEWLKTLGLVLRVEELNEANLQRAAQLLNKTNQMNLSTRRMTEQELINWTRQDNHKFWTFYVLDKFGDAGLTGLISLEVNNKTGRIMDFVLSCRVIGRKIEEAMLSVLIKYARSIGLDEIDAKYIPTAKNRPCLDFWEKSGFRYNKKDGLFNWKLRDNYPVPACVKIEDKKYEK